MDESSDDEGAQSKRRRTGNASAGEGSETSERLYTDSALVDHHPPITAIIPKKFWVLLLMLFGLGSSVFVLNVLNQNSQQWADEYGAQLVMAFDMMAGQGLVKWLSSFLVGVAAFYCIQIYLIRRHRNDDYRGAYRLWGWLAALLIIISLNATAGIHEIVFMLVRDFAKHQFGFGSKPMWWMIISLPAAILIGRVLFEIIESKLAVASLLLGCAAFVFAFMSKADALPAGYIETSNRTIVECNLMLIGYISIFFTTAVYSRFVYCDSQGLLVEKASRRTEKSAAREQKRAEREAAQAEKKEQRELEKLQRAEVAQARVKERAEKSKQRAESRKKPVASVSESKTTDQKQNRKSQPLNTLQRSLKKPKAQTVNKTSDPSRTIPDFQEISDESDDAPVTISLEDMQAKLAGSSSRSERKRLKKLIQREQRRAA